MLVNGDPVRVIHGARSEVGSIGLVGAALPDGRLEVIFPDSGEDEAYNETDLELVEESHPYYSIAELAETYSADSLREALSIVLEKARPPRALEAYLHAPGFIDGLNMDITPSNLTVYDPDTDSNLVTNEPTSIIIADTTPKQIKEYHRSLEVRFGRKVQEW